MKRAPEQGFAPALLRVRIVVSSGNAQSSYAGAFFQGREGIVVVGDEIWAFGDPAHRSIGCEDFSTISDEPRCVTGCNEYDVASKDVNKRAGRSKAGKVGRTPAAVCG
jgi:hypothetical protein